MKVFEAQAGDYDAWFQEEKGKLIFALEVEAFRLILPQLPRPWLEIGVGSGRFAQTLGIEAGVEPAPRMAILARQRGIKVFQGRGEHTSFPDASWGSIFLIVTLCFVEDPAAVIREAYRLLRPGGKVVLGLVLRESPWGQFYQAQKEAGHRFYRWATFYTLDQALAFLEEAGFRVESVVSALFQRPGEVREKERPRPGYFLEAGFTVITAAKSV